MTEIISKAAFARLCGVSKSRVSQWVAEGKLAGRALVRDGGKERINVAVARAQLKHTLDFSQRLGLNGLSTRLGAEMPDAAGGETIDDGAELAMKIEKLRQAQLMTARLENEAFARRGAYVDAAADRAASAWLIAQLLQVFDDAIGKFAAALAAEFGVPAAEVQRVLQRQYADVRARFPRAPDGSAKSE